jgi:6-phosphogluconolactonase
VSVDPTGRYVLVANYSGGNIAVFPIQSDGSLAPASDMVMHEGTLGPNRQRQEAPHPHQIQTDPTGQFVIVNDLGLDKTLVYRLIDGILRPHSELAAEPGAGPRHLAYHPLGRWVYRINELSNTMTALEWVPASGEFRNIQSVSTLREGFSGVNTTAQVLVAPYGKYVYGSNRGDNSIVLFNMDADTGVMTYLAHEGTQGETPRNFSIDPPGNFLFAANQATDNVVAFRIQRETGLLSASGVRLDVGTPVNVTFWTPQQHGIEARPGVTLSVFTNPAFIFDGTGLVRASFAWNAPMAREVEVRVGSPAGALLGRFPNAGGVTTDKWAADGTVFFLQDAGDNKSLTRENTLGTVTMAVRSAV